MFSYPTQTTTRIRTKDGGGVQNGKRKNIGRFDRHLPVGGPIATNNIKTNGVKQKLPQRSSQKLDNPIQPHYTEHHHHQDKSTNHCPLFFDIAMTIQEIIMFVNNGARQCFTFPPGRITAKLNAIHNFTMFTNVKVSKC